jgi:glycosyltransferase involved in cell wall biosynthesis
LRPSGKVGAIIRKRRFALLSPNYHPLTCGVGDHSMRLGGELLRRGHDAAVFTHAPATRNPVEPELPVFGAPAREPVALADAITRRIVDDGFSDVLIQYSARMWGASRFGSPALPLLAAQLAARGLSVTLIAHELFTPWRLRPDLTVGAALSRLQLGALMRSCGHIFVTTESRRRSIGAAVAGIAPPRGLHVMRVGPNAVPVVRTQSGSGHRIGLFSTMAVGKRFDVVIDAFEAVARAHPDAELVLIGDLGPPTAGPRRALEARLGRSSSAARVRLTGRLPLSEIAQTVASLDLYLFPMDTGANTRSGTLPVALGAGVPTIATKGTETDPLFVHGDNVMFANGLTGPAFAEAALALFADRTLAERVGRGGRALYDRELSWPRITDAFLTAIADPLSPDQQMETRG